MAEVDKLHLTKKRLQNLRMRSSGLQQLAVRVISKQLTFYTSQHDELEKLKGLPDILREKILQVVMKKKCLDMQGREMEFESLKVVFPLLLSPRTRYIELNSILSFCPEDSEIDEVTQWVVELLKHIGTRAPQVETLVIKRNNYFYKKGVPFFATGVEFNLEMAESLMKMQKLNRLTVTLYYFDYAIFLKICKNLPSLQYINVECIHNCGGDMAATEDVSSSLCNVKEIIYQWPPYTDDYLAILCTQNLPNIDVVGYDPNKLVDIFSIRKDKKRYHSLEFHGASNLRNISVDLSMDSAKQVESMSNLFPNVTCLMVNFIKSSRLGQNFMPKFDNIKQLHLLDPYYSRVFEKYLITYGQNLQSLYLGHWAEIITIDFNLIFKYCPKLEKLSLLNVFLEKPLSKIYFLTELKEFEWANIYTPYEITPDPQSKNLANILSAPKLEKVKLESSVFNQNDLSNLNSLIQENRILDNLNTLHVYFKTPIDEALANVLKSACAYLPKLTDFKFGKRYKFEDPLLPIQSTPLSDIDTSVCYMIGVFENES
ncbi:Hypothetical predicted protein [Cloeon dipterum]|uniref:Uncharacterized protein n=1 Tax=Cloeon dipterum TaxID=197152 RepID=A0A8S1DPE1_9INSE|nr:Hypothetical predicted protein [Cloeon dipterum]